ncbi:uncharacterized protein [Anabrus simplex]|uniref:uncharacterized protein n=1 Tax=Anabrus simplex TaxID=316456 RepID=UPI0035A327CF
MPEHIELRRMEVALWSTNFNQFHQVEEDRPMQQGHSQVAESPTAIKQRYEDTAYTIFKEQQQELKSSRGFLSYGSSRRAVEYSNFGNGSVVVHKPGPSPVLAKSVESQILKETSV